MIRTGLESQRRGSARGGVDGVRLVPELLQAIEDQVQSELAGIRSREKEPSPALVNQTWSTPSSWQPVGRLRCPRRATGSRCGAVDPNFGARHPAASKVIHGAAAVARQALIGALPAAHLHPALVNGAAGVVVTVRGRPFAVMGFTVSKGKIVEIDAIADPERVRRIAAAILSDD